MRFLIISASFFLFHSWVVAGETPPRATDSLEDRVQASIADWEKPSFATRNSATRQLREAGAAAYPALIEAAKNGSGEKLLRALDLLKSGLNSPNASVKSAARDAIEQIAASHNGRASRSAQQILKRVDQPQDAAQKELARLQIPPVQPLQLRINMPAVPAMGAAPVNGARRVSTRIVNGGTIVEVTEPGRKIKIESDATGAIRMEVTKQNQGVDVTERFQAANAAELKTKHPAASLLYEQNMQQPRAIMAQAIGGPGPPLLNRRALPNIPAGGRDPRLQIIEMYSLQIEMIKNSIAQQQNPGVAEALNRQLQRITENRDRLQREMNQNR